MDSPFLSLLVARDTPHEQRHQVLKTASEAQFKQLLEMVYNLLYENIPTTDTVVKTLKPYKKLLDRIIDNSVSLDQKKRLLCKNYSLLLLLLKALQPFFEDEVYKEVISGGEETDFESEED